jgi:uncharacterized membrane protein
MKRFDLHSQAVQHYIGWFFLIVMMLGYALIMGHLAVLRYDTFTSTAFDLGNMDQAVWNTLHGRLFQFTNQGDNWYGPPTRLAQHVEPILLPLSLLYLIHSDPRTLLIFQTLALASGALPVFLLTRKYLPTLPMLAPVMAAAYLLMPALLGLNIYDFHPVALATPFLLYALLALSNKRYFWFILACILAAACKEEVPFVVAMLGILVIWKYKLPRLGLALIIGGVLWTSLAFLVIEPHFSGAQHNTFWYRYAALGNTPMEAVGNILLHPWILFTTFITLDRLYYLASLVRSTGFLVLLAPEWVLPMLPNLAINLLSTDQLLYSGVYQYNASIIPFIMIGAIHGIERLVRIWCYWRGETTEGLRLKPIPQNAGGSIAQPAIIKFALVHFANTRLAIAHATNGLTHSAQSLMVLPATALRPRFSALTRKGKRGWHRFNLRMADLARAVPVPRLYWCTCLWIIVMLGLNFLIMKPWVTSIMADHEPGSREQHIQQLLDMIPPDASVSAGTNLNPHLTERQYVTIFPSIIFSSPQQGIYNTVQYVVVDLNDLFPEDKVSTANMLNELVKSKQFSVLKRAEGVVLLVRTTP